MLRSAQLTDHAVSHMPRRQRCRCMHTLDGDVFWTISLTMDQTSHGYASPRSAAVRMLLVCLQPRRCVSTCQKLQVSCAVLVSGALRVCCFVDGLSIADLVRCTTHNDAQACNGIVPVVPRQRCPAGASPLAPTFPRCIVRAAVPDQWQSPDLVNPRWRYEGIACCPGPAHRLSGLVHQRLVQRRAWHADTEVVAECSRARRYTPGRGQAAAASSALSAHIRSTCQHLWPP